MGNLEKEFEARQKCAAECALQLCVVWQPWRNGLLSVTEKRPLVSWRWSLREQGLGAGMAIWLWACGQRCWGAEAKQTWGNLVLVALRCNEK